MIKRVEEKDSIRYRCNGKLHRCNAPAIIWSDGDCSWWLYGNLHRYYGPAGTRYDVGRWHIHGIFVTSDDRTICEC